MDRVFGMEINNQLTIMSWAEEGFKQWQQSLLMSEIARPYMVADFETGSLFGKVDSIKSYILMSYSGRN